MQLFREGLYNNSTITFNNQNENISFFVADACSLSTDLPAFDVVHAANLDLSSSKSFGFYSSIARISH